MSAPRSRASNVPALILFTVASFGAGVLVGRVTDHQPAEATVTARPDFPTRVEAGQHQVYLATHDHPGGVWLPTSAYPRGRVVEFVPATLTPGPVAQVQDDGTVYVSDHLAASRRSASGR